jgi:hypothetical protein
MAAFNFPDAPTEGMSYNSVTGPIYIYQDGVWIVHEPGSGSEIETVDWSDIANVPATFPPTVPIAQSDITDLTTDLAGLTSDIADLTSNIADLATALASKVTKSGDTMTGNLAIAPASNASLTLSKTASGDTAQVVGALGAAGRWALRLGDNTAESGSNAGSNLVITRYTDAGTLIDTPFGIARSTGTISVANDIAVGGAVACLGDITSEGGHSATGASRGVTIGIGSVRTSTTLTTPVNHTVFYNPNDQVGAITTNGTATSYATSSDERLKEFTGAFDPGDAAAIIRADPVRTFTWKADGTAAVGWGAQTSHAISPDLATPPAEPDGVWGIDQGRRTPYLWAALSGALDKIAELEARLAALEAGVEE